MTTLTLDIPTVGGTPVTLTSAKLSDPTGSYGVRRLSDLVAVVADGTNLTIGATQVTYSLTTVAGESYLVWYELAYDGDTYYVSEEIVVSETNDTSHTISILINGALIDVTSIVSADEGVDYGVRDTETLDAIVAVSTAYTNISKGQYRLDFEGPETPVGYQWATTIVYSGTTYYVYGTLSGGTHNTTTVVLPATSSHYTSQAEVLRIVGTQGSELLLEDYTSQGSVWENLLQDADDTIKMYILQHYDPELLYNNGWIRRRATKLVANLLTSRRGNPPLYTSAIDRVYEELQMIRDGKNHIPGAKPRFFQGPLVRNYLMQPFARHPMRVQERKSTSSGTYSGQDFAIEPYVYYGVL